MTYKPEPEELGPIRGILFALPVVIVMWLIIGAGANWLYRVLVG